MNLDELRAVQNTERQKDSLQHLRESFYGEVATYIAELQAERDEAAAAVDDPFASRTVRQLTDEIETAKAVAEAIYERRLGKLVKRASLTAADMPADEEGLTAEERELYTDIVDRIEANKTRVLEVVEGEADPPVDIGFETGDREAVAGAEASRVAGPDESAPSAAAAMGAEGDVETGGRDGASDEREDRTVTEDGSTDAEDGSADAEDGSANADDVSTDADGRSSDVDGGWSDANDGPTGADDDGTGADGGATGPAADARTTVRITADVGEIYGVDDREYDLAVDDVVTLPSANAAPLLDRGAAEKVE